ncbi:MAG: isoprenylcysteine carboxyl methyltransferase [Chloroflexi bacterium HGW-Chloroflexi-4]|jgi:protein-S-isoprenylcysteine O-methyltransferase Ste14|nr:MAG: isoprenylcysteine carboxyl methyltransferase [Chloroflexi bacterium HGW-Chloroflexi-4]
MNKKTYSSKIIFQLIIVVIILPLLPMLISWHWNWWEAWIYALTLFLGFVISRLLAARKHPGIIAERAQSMSRKDAKSWDRVLAPSLAFGSIFVPLIAGLEEKFNWTPAPFPLAVKIAAIIIMILAYVFSSWAFIENAFFSGVVRLQTDRGHTVCDSGPYRLIRHPGYTGGFWSYIMMPIILDSYWSFIPVMTLSIIMIIRTKLEDQMLHEELHGYSDYASKVKHRLFPGIW